MPASRIPQRFVFAAGGDLSRANKARPGSRRDQKKDKTRRSLLETADSLFQRKGYEATTLEEICEGAEISLRTFFRYFESKRDLALYENMRNIARLRDMLAQVKTAQEALDGIEALYDFIALEFEQDEKARQRLFLMAKEPALVGRSLALDLDTEACIASALEGGARAPVGIDAQMLAAMIVGGVRRVVMDWVAQNGETSLRKAIAGVFSAARRSGLLETAVRRQATAPTKA